MEEDELLPGGRLHADEQLLMLAQVGLGTGIGHHEDAIRLTDARLRPRRGDGRVGDVEHDAVLLLGLGEPAGQLELTHLGERVSAEHLHDGSLVEIRRRSSDTFQSHVQLGSKLGDRYVTIRRQDRDGLSKLFVSSA